MKNISICFGVTKISKTFLLKVHSPTAQGVDDTTTHKLAFSLKDKGS